ncbi:MAG: DUF2207 domain-containing protein [Prevotella sp.]|nr:DUF2207 domain-containing protein [Prevotella sp.]MBR1449943.1 DUF2207 domain-containing protein [Prevotella sp.]
MMKRLGLLMVLLVAGLTAWADRGGFHYRNISVEANVNKNNEWRVTERLDVVFDEPRHGIYRYIPQSFWLNHDMADIEGGASRLKRFDYQSRISDLSVEGAAYETEEDNGNLVIRMGDANHEVVGDKTYVIHYTYTYRDDRVPAYDYLFHTILGTDFNEQIDNFTFDINFEKPLPDDIASRLKIYSGNFGNETNVIEGLLFNATPTKISGWATQVAPNHGVTLYALLPEGYYEDVLTVNYLWHYLFLAITILLILGIIVCHIVVRRGHITKSIEFYPPEGISSAEVGTIIDDSADLVDLSSLIPWLAGEGYLTIREEKKSGLLSKLTGKTELVLTKRKSLPKSAPGYQKKMMNMLFRKDDEVRMSDIGEQPQAIMDISKSLQDCFKGERKLTNIKILPVCLYVLLALFGSLTLGTNSVEKTFDSVPLALAFVAYGATFTAGFVSRLAMSYRDLISKTWVRLLVTIGKALCMMVVCVPYAIFSVDYGAPMGPISIGLLFVVSFVLGELAGRFNVDTPYRIEMMGRLLGFKEFIETAEKSRLEHLQHDDPNYYYTILPYAMVFGLSDKWAKLFKDINVEKPDWYDAATPLTGYALTNHLTQSLYSSVNDSIKTISHDSSSHGSGGSGGGGFSGGGGGGGGGGSW